MIYTTEGFVLKNSDAMHADMQAACAHARRSSVYPKLFPDEVLSPRTDRETSEARSQTTTNPQTFRRRAPPPQLASLRAKALGGYVSLRWEEEELQGG